MQLFYVTYMETLGDKKVAKSCNQNYYCNICDYNAARKSSYDKHLLTAKHQSRTNGDTKVAKSCKTDETVFVCKKCEKQYISRNGLWKHKKDCSEVSDKDLIIMLLKQNSELLLKIGPNNSNNTNSHNNNNNKTFNLQFFLNEECKDALNISEFVSSIKMDLDDLETTGKLGYVEGVTRIINKNLNELDQTKRPIHCSDIKREVLYIKDENQWVKENGETKPVLTKAIKQVAHENIKQISEWRKMHPDCNDPESKSNDTYLHIVSNAMSGSTSEEQVKNYEKIISNVAKEVIIEKV